MCGIGAVHRLRKPGALARRQYRQCHLKIPGSVTIDLSENRRTLYVHVMHMTSAEATRHEIKDGFERRVKLVFEEAGGHD